MRRMQCKVHDDGTGLPLLNTVMQNDLLLRTPYPESLASETLHAFPIVI